jgi:hypothetical protein
MAQRPLRAISGRSLKVACGPNEASGTVSRFHDFIAKFTGMTSEVLPDTTNLWNWSAISKLADAAQGRCWGMTRVPSEGDAAARVRAANWSLYSGGWPW